VDIKQIIEATLFAADRPLSITQVQNVFSDVERPERAELEAALTAIENDYQERPIQLQKVASGYRFQVREELSPWVSRLFEERPPKFSRALLETLAIIAYQQPLTRGDIEQIRGVSVSTNIIRTLLDREWVRVVGHKEVPGRPAVYATTKLFLDYFNLKSLDELPPLPSISELEDVAELMQAPMDAAGPGEQSDEIPS
jgi:segregation and condensation protein B